MPRGFKTKMKVGMPPKMEKGIPPMGIKMPQSKAMPFARGRLVSETPIVKAAGKQRKI